MFTSKKDKRDANSSIQAFLSPADNSQSNTFTIKKGQALSYAGFFFGVDN